MPNAFVVDANEKADFQADAAANMVLLPNAKWSAGSPRFSYVYNGVVIIENVGDTVGNAAGNMSHPQFSTPSAQSDY